MHVTLKVAKISTQWGAGMKAFVQMPTYYASHLSDFLQCAVNQGANSEVVYCEVVESRRLIIDAPSKFEVVNNTAFNLTIDGLISYDNAGSAQKIYIGFSNTTSLVHCHLGIGSVDDVLSTSAVSPFVLLSDGIDLKPK